MPAKEVDGTLRGACHSASRSLRAPVALATHGQEAASRNVTIVIVAAGSLDPQDERWLDDAEVVVAADGGAVTLDRVGRRPDRLIGDLDSTPPSLVSAMEEAGTAVDRHPVDKEASDLELALTWASEVLRGSAGSDIVVLGATGGPRLDHQIANLLLLAHPALAGLPLRLVHGPSTARVVGNGGRLVIGGVVGDLVSLLPIGGHAVGVSTEGLRWPLVDATLAMGESRGLSNKVVVESAWVSLRRGRLLVVETSQQGATAP